MSQKETATRIVKTFCQMCPWNCGINATVQNGKITRIDGMVEHPFNQGALCTKPEGAIDYVYSDKRLKYPLKKHNGKWERISWDEALDTIAAKLTNIKSRYGASALAVCIGDPVATRGPSGGDILLRLADVFGTQTRMRIDNFCSLNQPRAELMTFGNFLKPDIDNAKCLIIWAHYPRKSFLPEAKAIARAAAKGARVIVIDPHINTYDHKVDIYAQVRPGTDTALALGIMNVLINEKLYNKEFVEKWTLGFDKLAAHVQKYTPEEAEKITWVPASTIRNIARMISQNAPTCAIGSVGTLDKHATSFQSYVAMGHIQALTGSVGVPGGWIRMPMLPVRDIRLPEKMGDQKMLGEEQYPVFARAWGGKPSSHMGQTTEIADTMLTGKPYPVKALLVSGSNPVITWPDTNKFKAALEKLEFIVVMDIFMTATADMADIVLPSATFLERADIRFYHYLNWAVPYTMLAKPVIEPLWESWPDWKFYCELGRRLGYAAEFPYNSLDEILDYVLEPSKLTVEYLTNEKPEGVPFGALEGKWYEQGGFRTPSKKVELYSDTLAGLGYDPFPTHKEPPESPVSTPELAKQYPLILNTSAREAEFWHSEFRHINKLRNKNLEPHMEIHPQTAAKYGVNDGDTVIVESVRGSIEIKARLTDKLLPGVVIIPQGWDQANANILTSAAASSKETGYPSLAALLCRIKKKA